MESRFGYDFSKVRILNDQKANKLSRSFEARAFTRGNKIILAESRMMISDRQLIAHELTHMIQHSVDSRSAYYHDNTQSSSTIGNGLTPLNTISNTNIINRFSVKGHHIIEQAALEGSGLSKEEISFIHSGNVQRDFSQVGKILNSILLCKKSKFGGYKAEEHFDNFKWDKETQEWQTREKSHSLSTQKLESNKKTPIGHIETELTSLAELGRNKAGLIHLGNALHTIEDFFAHSNFVELIHKDYTFGSELLTGEVDPYPTSMHDILSNVSAPISSEFYSQQASKAAQEAPLFTHSKMAKDFQTNRYHGYAIRLAALVVQDLLADIVVIMNESIDSNKKVEMIKSLIFPKLRRYLRAPDNEKDPWWKELIAKGGEEMDRRIKLIKTTVPETISQCIFSPLSNIEASRFSSFNIPFGVVLPVKVGNNNIWLQMGGGVIRSLPIDRSFIHSFSNESAKVGLGIGAQITGTF